jgi:hypothetical protein
MTAIPSGINSPVSAPEPWVLITPLDLGDDTLQLWDDRKNPNDVYTNARCWLQLVGK